MLPVVKKVFVNVWRVMCVMVVRTGEGVAIKLVCHICQTNPIFMVNAMRIIPMVCFGFGAWCAEKRLPTNLNIVLILLQLEVQKKASVNNL